MTAGPGDPAPDPVAIDPLPRLTVVPADAPAADEDLHHAMDRHPSSLCRRLDDYLAAVARELRSRGVLACAPQRTDPAGRLLGSIVLDCTALLVDDWTAAAGSHPHGQRPDDGASLAGALHPGRSAPVVATWDEHDGWWVGLHLDAARPTRRYLPSVLFPASPVVADFVVGLALGRPLGSEHPTTPSDPAPGTRRLRAV